MGGKIPSTIRKKVYKEWLEGYTRDQIAKMNQIGAATVSAIVNECRQNIPDIDVLREVAVALRRENLNLGDFASAMRLRNKMIEWGLPDDDEMEDFIERVNVYCFKAGISPEKFINMVHNVTSLANQLSSSVDGLPSKILKVQKELKKYRKKAKRLRNMIDTLLTAYSVTEAKLDDYVNTRPQLIKENMHLRNIIRAYENDTRVLRDTNEQQELQLFAYKYEEM
ncbi:MAG: hypothetical protein ACRD8Z_06520, partial [Nitrososphaeraceae archaeon]